jgi:integrase
MYLFKPKYTRNGLTAESPNFAVEMRINGKRIVKGLGTPNKAAATQRAKDLERQLRDKPWQAIRPTLPGKRTPLARIIELYREINTERSRPLRPRTIRQNVNYLKILADRLNVDTVEDLAAKVGDFPRLPCVKHLSRRSLASVVRQASAVFSESALIYYRTRGLTVGETPFKAGIPYAPPPEPFRGYSIEFVRGLIETARKELPDKEPGQWAAFLLCLCAGLRQQEAAWLRKEDMLENGVLVTSRDEHQTKSGRHRFVPLPPAVLAELRAVSSLGLYAVPYGLTLGREQPEQRAQEVFRGLAAWLRTHGIVSAKPVHELRKAYGAIVASQFGVYAAKELLGHSTVTVTESHYAALLERPTVDMEPTAPVLAQGGSK